MADIYPRVFVPNGSFSQLAVVVSSQPGGGTAETADGEAPSVRGNLIDTDPSLRFSTAGTDGSRSYSWQATATAGADQPVNAAASLFYFSSAQVFGITLRDRVGRVLQTLVQDRAAVSGQPSLVVTEAGGVRSVRSYRFFVSQPASRRTVVGFVLVGVVEELLVDPFGSTERRTNLPVVVDPFEDLIERGSYGRVSFVVRAVSDETVARLFSWERAGVVLAEVARGDWRVGRIQVLSLARQQGSTDVSFDFVERLLGQVF